MASNLRPCAVVFTIIGISFLASEVNSIPTKELDYMLNTLRIQGYQLFCNAIVTSDLQFELLSGQNSTRSHRNYTIFAPINSSLFALDMTVTASSYIDTLRFHIVPRRLFITDLLRLPTGTSLPTLLSHRYLNVSRSSSSVSVGGVNITFPNLFYGRHVAVHGLNGIISLRLSDATGVVSDSPVDFRSRRSSPPRSGPSSLESHSVMAPSPTARPPGESIPPVNRKAHAPAREPSDASSHFHAASPFDQAVHPPDSLMIQAPNESPSLAAPEQSTSLDNPMIHTPEANHSPAHPPTVAHALTPNSESPEYPHSSISAPPLEYSDAEVPSAMSPDDVWLPNKHGVALIETFKGDSDGPIKIGHYEDEVLQIPQQMSCAREMLNRYKPFECAPHC